MDHRYLATQPHILHVQMDMQRIHATQQSHGDRIARLEKRQADDAALKSVWGNPPFPSGIGGTPQQGPIRKFSSRERFDDFDEQGQSLIGSLHLEADDEPVRRAVNASRANSVRFDESALQGNNWSQNSRHSGDFGVVRPGSAFGAHNVMERSLSHKSDGRHSSAGHSVHSIHSAPSGRASSLGLDTNFVVGSGDEESPVDIPEPPPGLFALGPVPSIVRCWLTEQFGGDTLLYAVACTGSQRSTIEHSLVKELDLAGDMHRDISGLHRIRLPVFLTEAIVTRSSLRMNGASRERPKIPSITTSFDVINIDQLEPVETNKAIRVVIGSDTLRAYSADVLFSRNTMTLLGDQREKLTVPFVRPEDQNAFKYLTTSSMVPGKPKLNANAAPFVSSNSSSHINSKLEPSLDSRPAAAAAAEEEEEAEEQEQEQDEEEALLQTMSQAGRLGTSVSNPSENGAEYNERRPGNESEAGSKKDAGDATAPPAPSTPAMTPSENRRRGSTTSGMWGPWRGDSAQRDVSSSSFASAQRSARGMKILKSSKLTSSGRTGAPFDATTPPIKPSGEPRRKSTGPPSESGPPTPTMRWDSKDQKRMSLTAGDSRAESKAESKAPGGASPRELRSCFTRSSNPVGGASAFKWMSSSGPGSKAPTAVAD